jgi:hypothetical protein
MFKRFEPICTSIVRPEHPLGHIYLNAKQELGFRLTTEWTESPRFSG